MYKCKKVLNYIVIFIIAFVLFSDNAFAEEGIYCNYTNSDGNYYFRYAGDFKTSVFSMDIDDTNFDEAFSINIEAGRPNKPITEKTELDWLLEKGLIINSNGKYKWSCPSVPFGVTGLTLKETIPVGNAYLDETPSVDEGYTCTYKGMISDSTLSFKYSYDYINGLSLEITRPDGTISVLKNTDVKEFPGKSCEDVYYITKDGSYYFSTSKYGVDDGKTVASTNYSSTYYQLCKQYGKSEIEQFCSGSCEHDATELICPGELFSDTESVGLNCEDVLGNDLLDFLNKILGWIQILAPIIVIILSSVDFASALLQDDKDALKKASNKLTKRLIIAVALFLVPLIVRMLLENFNDVKTGINAGTCGIGE